VRLMRGWRREADPWGDKPVLRRGWWLGFRHACWRGGTPVTLMRAVFISESMVASSYSYRRRQAVKTMACRHCQQEFRIQTPCDLRKELRVEVETLRKLGLPEIQSLGESTQSER